MKNKLVCGLLKVEATFGCNLRCPFCGLHSQKIGRQEYHYMEPSTFDILLPQIEHLFGEKGRMTFSGLGEPSMNPWLPEYLKLLRMVIPKISISVLTNGTLLASGKLDVRTLFNAGANVVMLDIYQETKAVITRYLSSLQPKGYKLVDFYKDWQPEGRHPWCYFSPKQKYLCIMGDVRDHIGESRVRPIHSFGGNNKTMAAPKEWMRKICLYPLKELSIMYDGRVPICCQDVGGQCILGDIRERSLKDIFWGRESEAARRLLRKGLRCFTPCSGCSSPTSAGLNAMITTGDYPAPEDLDLEIMNRLAKESEAGARNGKKATVTATSLKGIYPCT